MVCPIGYVQMSMSKGIEEKLSLYYSLKIWGGLKWSPNDPSLNKIDSEIDSNEDFLLLLSSRCGTPSSSNKFIRDAP